jgi:hypothetical protein
MTTEAPYAEFSRKADASTRIRSRGTGVYPLICFPLSNTLGNHLRMPTGSADGLQKSFAFHNYIQVPQLRT